MLRDLARNLDRMTANVNEGLPSALLRSSAIINDRGEHEEYAGHFTLERAADKLEATARDLRRAAEFEREMREERIRAALPSRGRSIFDGHG